jgi:hypothetical protein
MSTESQTPHPAQLASAIGALHLSRALYKFTLFMQNKANLLNTLMNVTSLITVDYENIANWTLGENKPNSKPIKPNSKPIKPKTNPKQTQNKPNSNPILSASGGFKRGAHCG